MAFVYVLAHSVVGCFEDGKQTDGMGIVEY